MRERKDFIMVRLSAAGEAVTGKSLLRIVTGRMHYAFTPGKSVEVLRSEWQHLRREADTAGNLLFEEATIVTPAKSADEGEES